MAASVKRGGWLAPEVRAGASGGEGGEAVVAPGDQRFLLGAGPALDLLLAGDGVEHAIVGFGEDQRDGAAFARVAIVEALLV